MEQRLLEQTFAPGTIPLETRGISIGHHDGQLLFQPQPSEDPNDPLNWSKRRKFVNFAIICFYALMTFTILDIGPAAWQDYIDELHMTWAQLNATFAANTAGLAVGCILFIPFTFKYGRRPVYIISTIVTFATSVWQAKLNTFGEMTATQVISGLSGAVSETIVQMTVIDMFYVHQRGTMNGVYLLMVTVGTFLAPVASGVITFNQGWRWMYWWTTILIGINILLFIFFYEETQFVPLNNPTPSPSSSNKTQSTGGTLLGEAEDKNQMQPSPTPSITPIPFAGINHSIPMKSYRERLALTTTTNIPARQLLRHTWQPFVIICTIPAITYLAIQYGIILAWFSILVTSEAQYFVLPPYNFSEVGIGLLQIPAFLGCVLGFIWGGPMSDWSILFFARRNGGIYEPEMRLYFALLPALVGPIGLFLYGYSTAAGMPWIVPCIGTGMFGFACTALGDVSLTYLSDSYHEIIGDSLVGIAFVRNVFATIVVYAQDPWTDAIGLHGMFTCIGCISVGLNLMIIPLIVWGKKLRIMSAKRYMAFAETQLDLRNI